MVIRLNFFTAEGSVSYVICGLYNRSFFNVWYKTFSGTRTNSVPVNRNY